MPVLGCAITNAGLIGRAPTPGWHSVSASSGRCEPIGAVDDRQIAGPSDSAVDDSSWGWFHTRVGDAWLRFEKQSSPQKIILLNQLVPRPPWFRETSYQRDAGLHLPTPGAGADVGEMLYI